MNVSTNLLSMNDERNAQIVIQENNFEEERFIMKRMMMKREKKFSGLIALIICIVFAFVGQAWSGPRDVVVNYAEEIFNYRWTTSGRIYLHKNATWGDYKEGEIRGIPYTLSSGQLTFKQYKNLSDNERLLINGSSMKYGMACAAFVTDCIRQGFNESLPMDTLTLFHKRGSWNGHVSSINSNRLWQSFASYSDWVYEWNNDFKAKITENNYDAYKKLQKGDYLDNYNHVILVVGNDTAAQKIQYIDQTPYWDSNNMVGTHRGEYSYSSLSNNYYVPMYVNYPNDNIPPLITTTSLPDAYVNEPYYARIETTGATPITFSYGTAVALL